MTSLETPRLGTDTASWQFYHLHLTGVYVLEEYFLASNYRDCIQYSEDKGKRLEDSLKAFGSIVKPTVDPELVIKRGHALSKWALEMREEKYHKIHTHAFIGMWSAFEAGIEDTIASIIRNDKQGATTCAAQFKKGRYEIAMWPWAPAQCLEIAQKLDVKAKEAAPNGGSDLFRRIQTLFSWLDIYLLDDPETAQNLAEASRTRNIILHRNGYVSEEDGKECTTLTPWIGKVVPMDISRFDRFYYALANTLIGLVNAMHQSRHKAR